MSTVFIDKAYKEDLTSNQKVSFFRSDTLCRALECH